VISPIDKGKTKDNLQMSEAPEMKACFQCNKPENDDNKQLKKINGKQC